eukprot:6325330-Karenia_brevis.AAC.1
MRCDSWSLLLAKSAATQNLSLRDKWIVAASGAVSREMQPLEPSLLHAQLRASYLSLEERQNWLR